MATRKTMLVLAVAGGLLGFVGGSLLGLGFGLLALLVPGEETGGRLMLSTFALAAMLIGSGLGLPLAWGAWRALDGRPGRIFVLPHWMWLALAAAAALGLGHVFFSAGLAFAVPPLHVASAVVPPLLFLSLAVGAARRRQQITGARTVAGGLAWGGLGAVAAALVVEAIAVFALLLAGLLWLQAIDPAFLERLTAFSSGMREGRDLFLPGGALTRLMRTPWVLVAVVGFAGFFVPLVEESLKALAVPLAGQTGRRLTRTEGFLLGAAAGAGFAAVEGVFNGAMALGAPDAWATAMAVRGAAAAMHCLASGLVGLGWQAAIAERRYARALGLGLLGVAAHGIWNALAVAQAVLSLSAVGGAAAAPGAGNLLAPMVVTMMAAMCLAAVLLLALLPGRLGEH